MNPGCFADLNRALSVPAPDDADYAHDTKWGDIGLTHIPQKKNQSAYFGWAR